MIRGLTPDVKSSVILAAALQAAPQVSAALGGVPRLAINPEMAAAADAPSVPILADPVSAPDAVPDRPPAIPRALPRPRPTRADIETQKMLAVMHDRGKELQDEQIRQARLTFNVAIGLVVVGVLIIFAGSVVMLLQHTVTTTGSLTAVGGAVVEVISVVLFRFHKQTNDKLDALRIELHAIQVARFDMTLLEKIEDPVKRDDAIREIVQNLRAHAKGLAFDEELSGRKPRGTLPTVG